MNELFTVAMITLLAVISPGGDFAMVTRNSLLLGRRAGLLTAWGVALGTWVHIAYTIIGVAVVVKATPWVLEVIKVFGAIYLIYIGVQTARSHPTPSVTQMEQTSYATAFKMGFLTNALNPKTTLFVVSLYSQVVSDQTTLIVQLGYGMFISLAHGVWFSIVCYVMSNSVLVERALKRQQAVNRCIGVILVLLGLTLASTVL